MLPIENVWHIFKNVILDLSYVIVTFCNFYASYNTIYCQHLKVVFDNHTDLQTVSRNLLCNHGKIEIRVVFLI